MKSLSRFSFLAGLAVVGALPVSGQQIVINEIMYHPASENVREEYIELFNAGVTNVNLTGWRLSSGVDYNFPSNTTINAGAYLVISAHKATFLAKYPAVPSARVVGDYAVLLTTNVVGRTLTNWANLLSNTRNTINLRNAAGNVVDSVTYADEGDWAIRQRGANDLGARGWKWFREHDGLGKSLELVNPSLPNDYGQNWRASTAVEGTPGAVNSVQSANVAPLLLETRHQPAVPRSTDPITITCRVVNETPSGLTVRLQWRIDALAPPLFTTNQMFDDGQHGDGLADDGVYGANLNPQPNNAIIEYFVSARDAQGNERTWPGPAIAAPDDGTGPTGQVVNALFQVDDNPLSQYGGAASRQPVYKVIMQVAERDELHAIPCNGPETQRTSDAQMNATFISLDAGGTEVRYRTGIRRRGHGSRCTVPRNYHINFVSDEPWKSAIALNLNSVQVIMQHLGSVLAVKSGAIGTYSRPVLLRVNNTDVANAGSPMFGSYAANEVYNGDWAERHLPNDDGGNIYKVIRDIDPPNFDYRGEDKNSYTNTYYKDTNASEDDWQDIIGMLSVMGENSTDLFTADNVRAVINVEQWMTHMAVMAIFANNESGLFTGNNDDYYMYRGVNDPRFLLLYHDLDSILGAGGASATADIFRPTCCPVSGDSEGTWRTMNRFLNWPDFRPIYMATFQRLLDTTFSEAEFNSLVDQTLGDYANTTARNNIKTWMNQRRTFIQGQISGQVPPATISPIALVTGEPRSPTPFRDATLVVGGEGITHYRYKLNNGAYGAETPVGLPITLTSLPNNSTNVVAVIGRNAENVWQDVNSATLSRVWIVNTAWPSVRINEVLARNDSALPHEGTFPDAIELFNEGPGAVDLSGMRLTDELANPNKFVFPAGTPLLAAGNYLTVYAADPDDTSGFHLSFTLDQDGEGVFLVHRATAGGSLLDSVEYGIQLTDHSIGRIGGSGTWVLAQPTFGSANLAQTLGVERNLRINEWLASGLSPFAEDFIELYNPGSAPVALGGLYLTDTPYGDPQRHRIPDLSFIPAQGFVSFIADGNGGSPDRVSFGLDSDQGEIALFSARPSLIDRVIYGPQRPGISQGRCPDGSATNRTLVIPTPAMGNACPVPPTPPVTVGLVPYDAVWNYDQVSNYDGIDWTATDFDDGLWTPGPGVLARPATGSISQPVRTTLQLGRLTYYFRTRFTVLPNSGFTSLQITHFFDDGAVVYLNGKEAYRHNMPGGQVQYATLSGPGISGAPPEVGPLPFPLTNMVVGENFLAVEVHQSDPGSSDIYMGLKLDGVIASAAPGSILLNEILANNATSAEPDGSTPDLVELYNPTGSAVDLAGLSLADSGGNRWIFPAGSIINGQGFYTVRFDADRPASSFNTGFGLKAAGDIVTLYNRAPNTNTPMDTLAFGLQTADFSVGRIPSGSNWVLNVPTLGSGNIAASVGDVSLLKVNEWLADPLPGESDWFEIYNPNSQPVNISHCYLGDNSTTHRLPALCFIGAVTNAWQRFFANDQATPADQVPFKLGSGSDSVRLANSNGVPIDSISWSSAQTADVSEGRLPDGTSTILRFPGTASPGEANFVGLTNVVINEVLAHTDPPREDAIEIHNPTASPVSVAGWWLSDSRGLPQKYQIPLNTPAIPAGGFLVLYEYQFNDRDQALIPFALSSADGDQVYLSVANASGTMNGFRTFVDFGPSANGVSFGRYRTSVGFDFPAMSQHTFGVDNPTSVANFRTGTGKANVYPKVGPIVISEVMYHPPDVISQGVTNDNLIEEFVELRNISTGTFPLYDPAYPTNGWRLRDGVDFRFNNTHSIPPGGHLILVSFDPVANTSALNQFRARYGTNLALVGPYSGKLDNGGESVELVRPDTPQTNGSVPYIMVDKVAYRDRAPWPTNADGFGQSLHRVSGTGYGNDPTNWVSAAPAPGVYGIMDSDSDGMPDDWEDLHGFLKFNSGDAGLDFDQDGLTNLEEYLAGTLPKDAGSVLRLSASLNAGVRLQFNAIAGKTYSIIYREAFNAGSPWLLLTHLAPVPSNQVVTFTDPPNASPQRFYRLITPALP